MIIEDYEKFIRQELMHYRSEVEKIATQRVVSFEEEYMLKNRAAKMIGVSPGQLTAGLLRATSSVFV